MSDNKKYKAGTGWRSAKREILHVKCRECGWSGISDECDIIRVFGNAGDLENLFCPECGMDDFEREIEVVWGDPK